jgi:hypothetical protein
LKASECADYMGVSSEYIRKAITTGVLVHGILVKLDAETLTRRRHTYRIHEHAFVEFLMAIGWKHLPSRTPAVPAVSPRVHAFTQAKGA